LSLIAESPFSPTWIFETKAYSLKREFKETEVDQPARSTIGQIHGVFSSSSQSMH